MADLHQELAVLGEFQNLRVLGAVASDPHVALVVDVDAMVGLGPLVALPRATPGSDEISGRIEREYGRCSAATFAYLELQRLFVIVERRRTAMNDPDIVLI